MSTELPFRQILYCSQLAPGREFDVLASISRHARLRNAELGITGVLLFDGQRFCQLLQGPAPAIKDLMVKIALDERHGDVAILSERSVEQAAAGVWLVGYCEADDLDSLVGLRDEAALQCFDAIRQRADLAR